MYFWAKVFLETLIGYHRSEKSSIYSTKFSELKLYFYSYVFCLLSILFALWGYWDAKCKNTCNVCHHLSLNLHLPLKFYIHQWIVVTCLLDKWKCLAQLNVQILLSFWITLSFADGSEAEWWHEWDLGNHLYLKRIAAKVRNQCQIMLPWKSNCGSYPKTTERRDLRK